MKFRKLIGLSIGISFVVLFITGLLSFYTTYSRSIATLHTVFGLLFTVGVLFHLKNNFRPLASYSKGKMTLFVVCAGALFFVGAKYETPPFKQLMDFGASAKSNSERMVNPEAYELVEMNTSKGMHITLDLLRGEHYWHPQMAVWIEDEVGNYIETLFVSKATAKGLFFGGRSKSNFKTFDTEKQSSYSFRRVNALPVWSHKRGVRYKDGAVVPTRDMPLPDAITGETLVDNFILTMSTEPLSKFRIKVELNVAFDDNEFYSEYDFPDDETFHNGTGQLGQPSIVFSALVDSGDGKAYYLMDLIGHGHHSAQNGTIYSDLSTLTTAKDIVERIVVGIKRP
ncbi:hypothetical protein [Flagellimonas sp. 2504JD4-2]